MVTRKEFEIIRSLLQPHDVTQDSVEFIYKSTAYRLFESKDEIKTILNTLIAKKYIDGGVPTQLALADIASLKVHNAVILAAGGSEISSKSIYSMPKGLFVKNGETLIERQIRQLKEAGIDNITVVIGYKQELYFFLQDKWGVELEVNPNLKAGNIFSLYVARKHLGSTYVCNCDNYFEKNPFSAYEYESFHASIYKSDAHNELVIRKNSSGRILEVTSNARNGECIYGHAYFNPYFSKKTLKYMDEEIDDFRISTLFWEEFVNRHMDELDLYAREYPDDFVCEFDSIQEIQNIDSLFLDSVSERINEKICSALDCEIGEINDISILQKGLTNILFTFVVRGERYIFRYPGDSSSFFIYRKNECVAQLLAARAHADDTLVYIDESGVKISKFRENCRDIHGVYYQDVELMKRIARKIKAMHDEGCNLKNWQDYNYNPIFECERLFKEASKMKGNLFETFEKEWVTMRLLQKYADLDGIKHTMCHNDINIDNVLVTDTTLDIIDWEFAGYNDPAYDFGRVIAGLEYDVDDPRIDCILEAYFGRPATESEHLHWMAYSAIHNWYYVGWALYKESIGESSRDWMLFFYKQAKKIADWCLPRYEAKYGKL